MCQQKLEHIKSKKVKQILKNCTLDDLDVEVLPTFDMEHLFLNIRSKSVGETSDIIIECEKCEESIPINFDLSDIYPTIDENHTPQIKLNDSSLIHKSILLILKLDKLI